MCTRRIVPVRRRHDRRCRCGSFRPCARSATRGSPWGTARHGTRPRRGRPLHAQCGGHECRALHFGQVARGRRRLGCRRRRDRRCDRRSRRRSCRRRSHRRGRLALGVRMIRRWAWGIVCRWMVVRRARGIRMLVGRWVAAAGQGVARLIGRRRIARRSRRHPHVRWHARRRAGWQASVGRRPGRRPRRRAGRRAGRRPGRWAGRQAPLR
jgi:hypothetical protein